MTLGVPGALWLLAALPVIVILYMLRARRQEVSISSVLLWQWARRDLLVQMPVRRLERSLLLLLQLLAAALVVLALARPQAVLPAAAGPATVVVLDASASMQATDVTPSRFDAARADALAEIARSTGPVMVVEAGPQPRAVTGFVDSAAARAAVARLSPTDAPARLDQAVSMALAQRSNGRGVRVMVFTDHGTAPAPGVEYRLVGRGSRNLAVAGVRAERTSGGTAAVVQVRNAGTAAERVPLAVWLDDRRILERTVEVPAGTTVSVPVHVAGRGVLKAQISPADFLAVDDTGYAVIGAPATRVLVVGERDRVLEEALQAAGASVTASRAPDAQSIAAADVVVLNRTPPVELPPGNYLLLGTTASNLPLAVDGVVPSPQVLRWSHSHPVMRYVDLRDVVIAQTLALRTSGGDVLAEGEVPIIWAYSAGGIRAVVVGFALHDSDLALQIAFPIFLSNAVSWLSGAGLAYDAGQALAVPAGPHAEAVLVTPDGSRTVLRAQGGQFVVPVLQRVGIYAIQFGGRTRRVAVNPVPSESEIAPAAPAAGGASSVPPDRTRRPISLAPVVLLAAVGVLLVEWALWLRSLPRARTAAPLPRWRSPGPSVVKR